MNVNEPEKAIQQAQLRTLMKLAFILDAAGEGVLGKGAPAMMYQAGLDAGRDRPDSAERTDALEEALSLVLTEGEDVWQIERWRDPGQEADWVENGSRRRTWLVFRRCPLLTLARRTGSSPGGLLCQALHGYMAGSMERIMDCRMDMRVAHCGPHACKVMVETKD